MSETMLDKARKEISEAHRNIWIQEYVSRRENPVIAIVYFLLLGGAAYFSFQKYFAQGSTYNFWQHLLALIALRVILGTVHSVLNAIFKKAAGRRCPVEVQTLNPEALPDEDALLSEYKQLQNYQAKGFNASSFSLLAPVIIVLAYGYFAWFLKLSVPTGCVTYLVWMCVLLFFYGCIVVICASQSLTLPLSTPVTNWLQNYEKEEQARMERERIEQEEQALREEQRAKAAAERAKEVQKSEELYAKATAQEKVDQDLLFEAAEMGSVNACKDLGRLLFDRMGSKMHTASEKSQYAEKIASCLQGGLASGDAEVRYLWYYARTIYEKNTLEGWQSILDGLRKLLESGKLSSKYEAECVELVQDLIGVVNSMAQKRAEREARPKHYRCRYCAGGMCTLNSSSTTLYTCNYVAHPESCPHNLMNHSYLEIVYDD
jgi:hypothetical protein